MIRQINPIKKQTKIKKMKLKNKWTYLWKKADKKLNNNQNYVIVSRKKKRMMTKSINKLLIRILIKKNWAKQERTKR